MGDKAEILYQGEHLRLMQVDSKWEFIERTKASGVVIVAAVTPAGCLLLIEQVRKSLGAPVIELPAGLVDGSENFADAAIRELEEETGYTATAALKLSEGPPSAGLSSEVVTFFRATGLSRSDRPGAGEGDGDEDITLHEVPLGYAARWLACKVGEGVLVDPKVYAGLHFLGAPNSNPC